MGRNGLASQSVIAANHELKQQWRLHSTSNPTTVASRALQRHTVPHLSRSYRSRLRTQTNQARIVPRAVLVNLSLICAIFITWPDASPTKEHPGAVRCCQHLGPIVQAVVPGATLRLRLSRYARRLPSRRALRRPLVRLDARNSRRSICSCVDSHL